MNKLIKQMIRIFVIVFITATFAAGALSVANIGVDDYREDAVIPITVTIADNVGSVDITLKYDPTVAKIAGIRDGDMDITDTDTKDNNMGIVRVSAQQRPDSEGMYGTFVIATIVLERNTEKYMECPLEITIEEFREQTPAAKSMVYSTSDGIYRSHGLVNVPGFLGVLAIAIILAAAYLIERRRRG